MLGSHTRQHLLRQQLHSYIYSPFTEKLNSLTAMALKLKRPWTTVIVGVFLGFTASSWLIVPQVLESKRKLSPRCSFYRDSAVGSVPVLHGNTAAVKDRGSLEEDGRILSEGNSSGSNGRPVSRPEHFIYVGVMTAKKYLGTRVVAAYKTWAHSIPGKVEFFSSAGSGNVHVPISIPLVSLAGVDDSYPPQKKSFMMLKYIHDHYLDKYEWFMRADDDVYIKGVCVCVCVQYCVIMVFIRECVTKTPQTQGSCLPIGQLVL